jgi:DNA repair protein RadC
MTLLNHFGSIANLARASVQDLSAFLSRDKAAQLVSSLRLAAVALREERTRLACSDASGPFPGSEA